MHYEKGTGMTFDEYSKQAIVTDKYGGGIQKVDSHAFMASLLGIGGEAGEITEKVKKIYWHKDGVETAADREELIKELGDLLWYTNTLSVYLGVSLDEVARRNIEKLQSRNTRGVLAGNGDNR